VQYCVRETR